MTDVLIVGAGPTGLALALWLTAQDVAVRIIDRSAGPGETSRAMAVQARTLELYRQMDLADRVVAEGNANPAFNLWVGGKRRARLSFGDAGRDLTPYPFLLVYPQDRHERVLIDRLAELGVTVERHTELLGFEEDGEQVIARLRLPDGSEDRCTARYLAGCDGARSAVRHAIGAGFDGGTYRQLFYVADVDSSGLDPADEVHVAIDSADFVAILSYGGGGRGRLVGTVRDERAERGEALGFDDVGHEAIERLGVTIDRVNWFSTYRVHHRVADRFRRGRVFLLGDAAHVHSPAGGQGMNTGIADAVNLAWKLAAVLRGRAPDGLLDSYVAERQAFARTLVETTDRLFSLAASGGRLARFVRTHVAPTAARLAYSSERVRRFLFRTVSQTALSYRDGPLGGGKAGKVQGGDRLPWVAAPQDNHEPLRRIGWQLHLYGDARPDLAAWCDRRGVALHQFDWRAAHGAAGLAQGAAYLIRPDTYVALADPDPSPGELDAWLATQGIAP